jgi:hypothetical protein
MSLNSHLTRFSEANFLRYVKIAFRKLGFTSFQPVPESAAGTGKAAGTALGESAVFASKPWWKFVWKY